MKKWKLLLAVGTVALGCAGCGAQKPEETGAVDIKPVDIVQTESEPEETEPENAQTASETEAKNDNYDDLEKKTADGDTVVFAKQIQAAVAAKDMEMLADLCFYPLAVNGEVVESKAVFMELETDIVFTEERCAVIEAVDASALEETMAGIVMGEDVPNIIFKSVDGELGITGIN